jgi:hypothetical protein
VIVERQNGYLTNYCDRRVCGKRWDYADDFYCCKICPNVQFCEECQDNLKTGKLKRFICSKNHDWFHIPRWDDEEYMKIGKGNVRIGGEMKDGARVGGQGVPISEWPNLLRDEWGIPRIEKPKKRTRLRLRIPVSLASWKIQSPKSRRRSQRRVMIRPKNHQK